jgi:hypothetical protein
MDQELIYNCADTLSAIVTVALMLKKKEERSVVGLEIG